MFDWLLNFLTININFNFKTDKNDTDEEQKLLNEKLKKFPITLQGTILLSKTDEIVFNPLIENKTILQTEQRTMNSSGESKKGYKWNDERK